MPLGALLLPVSLSIHLVINGLSLFFGGLRKHASSFKFGVVEPCHGEGSGITFPSQWTHPSGNMSGFCPYTLLPLVWTASGTHGRIVPTGISDNEFDRWNRSFESEVKYKGINRFDYYAEGKKALREL